MGPPAAVGAMTAAINSSGRLGSDWKVASGRVGASNERTTAGGDLLLRRLVGRLAAAAAKEPPEIKNWPLCGARAVRPCACLPTGRPPDDGDLIEGRALGPAPPSARELYNLPWGQRGRARKELRESLGRAFSAGPSN